MGDLIVYRHGAGTPDKGHVIMYLGNNMFIHCTGNSYKYNDSNPSASYDSGTSAEKDTGAVQMLKADDVFVNTSSTRYLFRATEEDTFYNFSLLRPFNRGLTPTEEAIARMSINGISVEKSVSAGQYNAVTAGETITYTITLENTTSSTRRNVNFNETLPAGVSYVSGTEGMVVSGSTLSWTGTISANKTVTLTYKVKVSDSATSGTLIKSASTKVNGVEINDLTITVSGYSTAQLADVAVKAKTYASSAKTFTDPILMAKKLYQEALGVTLFDETTAVSVLSQLIDTSTDTCRTDTDISEMLVPNLYGGLDIKSGYIKDCERTRLVIEDYLEVGDIIVAEYDGNSVVYVYVGNSTLIGIDSTGDVCTTYTIDGNEYAAKNILVTLIAYDRYAILRPSMAA